MHDRNPPISPNSPTNISRGAPGASSDDVETRAVIYVGQRSGERYDLSLLFAEWEWYAGYRALPNASVRVLARVLKRLAGAGLIERRRVRRRGRSTLHLFELTALGREAVEALSGRWIKEDGE